MLEKEFPKEVPEAVMKKPQSNKRKHTEKIADDSSGIAGEISKKKKIN